MRTIALLVLLLIQPAAFAQIGLPPVRVPQLPGAALPNVPAGDLPLDPDRSAAQLADEIDPRRLRELRSLRIRALLSRHRDVIEADPHGAPIVRGELLALAPQPAALQAASAAGFAVVRERSLEGLGTRIVVLHASGSTARALQRLQTLDPAGAYDFNHIYTDSGTSAPVTAADADIAMAADDPNVAQGVAAGGGPAARVSLIDSGVDVTHKAFSGPPIQQHGCAGRAVPAEHGTAVASLMVARTAAFHGAAPGSTLYAADVFCGLPTGGAVDAVAEAFAWLAEAGVPVINVSLVGPPNRLLEVVGQGVLARGHIVVAAVGNNRRAAPPLNPAACQR